MARIQTANGPSDLRPQFAGRHAGSFFQVEAWMPSEIKAISPLVDRVDAADRGVSLRLR